MPNIFEKVALWALLAVVLLIAFAFIGLIIYVKATYWNTPIGEIPSWALPFLK